MEWADVATPDDFSTYQVAIVGLGLMGGSLALALRGKCAGLIGVDLDPGALELARRRGVVDRVTDDPGGLLPEADLIVLAAPVCAILDLLDHLPSLHPGPAMVLDLGSTKFQVVQKMAALPARFDPLGGHPMCGKEHGGLANADPQIYLQAPFALTPLPRSSPQVRKIAEQLVQAVGARPVWLDPETHDRWVAATSGLPYLVANALAAVTPEPARPLIGPGLRSTTRLAPTPWSMMGDILSTNQANVLAGLSRFRERIQEMERQLTQEGAASLQGLLAEGAEQYEQFIERK